MSAAIDVVFANLHLGGSTSPPLSFALSPKRAFAPLAVAAPRGVRHAVLGGLLGANDRLALAVELSLIRPTESPRPGRAAPIVAVLAGVQRAAELVGADPTEAMRPLLDLWGPPRLLAPLLYCRRCGRVVQARRRDDGTPLLRRADADEQTAFAPFHLLSDSGDADVDAVREMVRDQGRLIALGAAKAFRSPRDEDEWLVEHPCASDRDRARWDPDRGGYPYAEEWLTPLSYTALPLLIEPHAATALESAAAFASGGPHPTIARHIADPIEAAVGATVFDRERDERATLAALHARLRLIEPLLAQLDNRYRRVQRAFVEWRDDSAGTASTSSSAMSSFGSVAADRCILRSALYAPVESDDGRSHAGTAFAPEGADDVLMPDGMAELLATAESEHRAVLLMRGFGKRDDKQCELTTGLLDVSPLRGALFRPGDRIDISGGEGRAILSPTGQTSPDDGVGGVAVRGRLLGVWAKLQRPGEIEGCVFRWSPKLGEALDLHAVGVRLLDVLLTSDAHNRPAIRRGMHALRTTLESQCLAQSAAVARAETFERVLDGALAGCSADDLWSSRAVHFRREARAAAVVGPLGLRYWRAACAFALRLCTHIEGVSYCPHRAADAPRRADGTILPLVEFRGLIALLEDALLMRRISIAEFTAEKPD